MPRVFFWSKYIPIIIFKLAENQAKLGKKLEAYINYRQLYIKYPNHKLTSDAKTAISKLVGSNDINEIPLSFSEHAKRIKQLLKGARYKEIIAEITQIKKGGAGHWGRGPGGGIGGLGASPFLTNSGKTGQILTKM